MEFFDRLDALRARWNVLEHPFYLRWSAGELSGEELARYAGEYHHVVSALASAAQATARTADPSMREELEAHAHEEAEHVALWDSFARAVGGELDRSPNAATAGCVEAWTAGRDPLEGLTVLYSIEAGQPAVSKTKLEGLVRHYGVDEGPATAYFALHAERDHGHAAQSRRLIEERLDGADAERLLALAERALRANWELLDGVEQPAASGG
jgi:pyrroloquinoline-quinone synthase